MAARHLVLVGGGHAHLTVLEKLREGALTPFRVTLIDPSPRHFYAGMAAGLLSGIHDESDACLDLRALIGGAGRFVQARVDRIDPRMHRLLLSSGELVSYDIASFCIGARILRERVSGDPEGMLCVLPVENLLTARRRILRGMQSGPFHLVVAGGGPAGVETAAHLRRLQREAGGRGRICLAAGGRLLGGFAPRFRELALESLRRRGVEVCEGVRVVHVEQGGALLSDETERRCDLAILAVGARPPALFDDSGLTVGRGGGLLVDEHLRCFEHPRIFGAGDCIERPPDSLPKTGGHALREGEALAENLRAVFEEEPLRPYEPPEDPLTFLDLGDGTAMLHKRERVVRGRSVLRLKQWYDRRFVRRYRALAEAGGNRS